MGLLGDLKKWNEAKKRKKVEADLARVRAENTAMFERQRVEREKMQGYLRSSAMQDQAPQHGGPPPSIISHYTDFYDKYARGMLISASLPNGPFGQSVLDEDYQAKMKVLQDQLEHLAKLEKMTRQATTGVTFQ